MLHLNKEEKPVDNFFSDYFTLIQELINCLSGLSVCQIPASDEGVLSFINKHLYGMVNHLPNGHSFLALFHTIQPENIYEIKCDLYVHLLAIRDTVNSTFLIIGPCLTDAYSDDLFEDRRLKFCATELMNYYRCLPVLSAGALNRLGLILAQHLFPHVPQPVPYHYLEYTSDLQMDSSVLFVEHYDELLPMRQMERRYELSAALISAVRHGNFSLAFQLYRPLFSDISTISRSYQPLRNAQNLCIIMNSQLRYAVEGCGIHPFLLDEFSQEIAIQIETLHSIQSIRSYSEEILKKYCDLVQKNSYPEIKPLIREVITYIKTHLSDYLTVKDTSAALTISADYLSHTFHLETGMTFTEFVNRERIAQAASLLKTTQLQIQQISSAVGYNNASYFSKQFTKYMNMTPRAYRANKLLS